MLLRPKQQSLGAQVGLQKARTVNFISAYSTGETAQSYWAQSWHWCF